MIIVAHKRTKVETLRNKFGDCIIADVTSQAKDGLRKLSPFYPHGNIPIPNSSIVSESVEGVWQGLKVFEGHGVDYKSFENRTGKNIKRTIRKFGKPIGHQYGTNNKIVLNYIEARLKIYLPTYRYVLEKYCSDIIDKLQVASSKSTIILLDYTTNGNVFNGATPLSHAHLVKAYAEGRYEDLFIDNQSTKAIKKGKSTTTEFDLSLVYKALSRKTLSSKGILHAVDSSFSARKLTSILKRDSKIKTHKGKPLKFSLKENDLRLFK